MVVAGQEKERFVLLLLGVGCVAAGGVGGGVSGVAAHESDEEASGERRVASAASHGAHQFAAHALGQSAVEDEDDAALRRVEDGEEVGEGQRVLGVEHQVAEQPGQAEQREYEAPEGEQRAQEALATLGQTLTLASYGRGCNKNNNEKWQENELEILIYLNFKNSLKNLKKSHKYIDDYSKESEIKYKMGESQ